MKDNSNRNKIHFCDVPQEALCGFYLAENNFKLYYSNTSNNFAAITCIECRDEIRKTRFTPNGFEDPEEWN